MINNLIDIINIISPGSSDVIPYTLKGKIPNKKLTSQFVVAEERERPSSILNALNLDIKYYNRGAIDGK